MACDWWDLQCKAGEVASNVVGSAIENMANAVMEAYGKALASLGTVWVHIGTPNLTGTGGSSTIVAGTSAPDSGNITSVLGLSLIHISEPTRRTPISYAGFCLKKK